MPTNKRDRRIFPVMDKPAGRTRGKHNLRGLRSIAAVIGIFLIVLVGFGALVSRRNAEMRSSSAAPVLPTATPDFSENKPAKEYVYAGSKLLAVSDAGTAMPADLAIWRPSNGAWWVLGGPGSQTTTYTWGQSGDVAVQGDYDSDGKTDFSIFRPSTFEWHIVYSGGGGSNFTFGAPGDLPAQADYDGDGRADATVFRPSDGYWYIQGSTAGFYQIDANGQSGDTPAPADYDGDGRADVAFIRGSTFHVIKSTTGQSSITSIGYSGTPVSADFDGDSLADHAVYVASTGYWYIQNSTTGLIESVHFGNGSDDIPVQNDYDADGRVDIAVWRPSTGYWYIRQSSLIGQSTMIREELWGETGDIPVPAFYRR